MIVSPHADRQTGLMNRRAFDELADHTRFDTMALLDLDHFRRINHSLGSEYGDSVLGLFARLLNDWCATLQPMRGHPFRVGGQEFAVLTADPDAERLAKELEALQHRIPAYESPDGRIQLTFSAGVSEWRSGEQPDDVWDRCKNALLSAKRAGRARVVVWGPGLGDGAG